MVTDLKSLCIKFFDWLLFLFIVLGCLVNCSTFLCFSCHWPVRVSPYISKVVCTFTSSTALYKCQTFVRLKYAATVFVTLLGCASVFLCTLWIFLYCSAFIIVSNSLFYLAVSSTGGSRLSRTAVKPDSHLAQIFCQKMYNLIFV